MRFLALSFAFLLLVPLPRLVLAAEAKQPVKTEYLLHLPGIAGERNLDRHFCEGLRDGGYGGKIEIFDWPRSDPGLNALLARQRNEDEADKLSKKLEETARQEPKQNIRIVCHSGGAGIAVWALERLPDDVKIETLVFVAPALSQRYDLSKALSHVRGKAYAFTSENDVLVLGAGTSLFGTIDGVKEQAAGMRGFTKPEGAADEQYRKLVQLPYRKQWMEFGNIGDHIGPMDEKFAANVISPLLQDRPTPTTRRSNTASRPPARNRAASGARSSPPTPVPSPR
jgi:pimeloyl-ACP methyl ester carboxylesterase